MCTSILYNAGDHYFGRNLDLEVSFGFVWSGSSGDAAELPIQLSAGAVNGSPLCDHWDGSGEG